MTNYNKYVETMDWLVDECTLIGRALINENTPLAQSHQWGVLVHMFGDEVAKEVNDKVKWNVTYDGEVCLNLMCCKLCTSGSDQLRKELCVAAILWEIRRQVFMSKIRKSDCGISLADL